MQFLVVCSALIILAVAVYGEVRVEEDSELAKRDQFPCGDYYDGFYCINGHCRPKRSCGHHSHCPSDQYCDMYLQACRKGVRRCYHQSQCAPSDVCKGGVCVKRECIRHRDYPGNQACYCPPGLCRNYSAYCYEGYDNYCKSGYACVERQCKKKECFRNYECKIGDICDGGFCKPLEGFCMKDGDCDKGQCCAGIRSRGGPCRDLRKPGAWCPPKQNMHACPCVSGYVCNMKSSLSWGKCEPGDGGSGSGSGLGDF